MSKLHRILVHQQGVCCCGVRSPPPPTTTILKIESQDTKLLSSPGRKREAQTTEGMQNLENPCTVKITTVHRHRLQDAAKLFALIKIQLCHTLALWLQARDTSILSLSFFVLQSEDTSAYLQGNCKYKSWILQKTSVYCLVHTCSIMLPLPILPSLARALNPVCTWAFIFKQGLTDLFQDLPGLTKPL